MQPNLLAKQIDVERFLDQGYAVIDSVFSPDDFDALRAGYSDLLDREAAGMLANGSIDSYDPGLPFDERLIDVCRQCEEIDWTPFDITFSFNRYMF